MVTVNELLSLPSMAGVRVIGGENGLSHTVSWPYVILCPPISEWVSGGEFLIYYGANSVVEQVELKELVMDAARNKAAAILFLVGKHYILEENLNEELSALADELKLPVLALTSRAFVNSITKDIISLLLRNDQTSVQEEEFLFSLFFRELNVDLVETLNQALYLGYLPSYTYCVYVLRLMNQEAYFSNLIEQHGKQFVESESEFNRMIASRIGYMIRQGGGGAQAWHIAKNNTNVIVLPSNTAEQEAASDRLFLSICAELEKLFPGTQFCVGKGYRRPQLSGIRESFLVAQRCLLAYKLLGSHRHMLSYKDLGFYLLLFEIPTLERIEEYRERFLLPILNYDKEHDSCLFETLCAYTECRYQKVKTAEVLFLHRNTLLTRLDRIDKILEKSLGIPHATEDAETLFQLQAAIRIQRFLNET